MSFAHNRPGEEKVRVERLFGGRWRVTRRLLLKHPGQVNDAAFRGFGAEDLAKVGKDWEVVARDLRLVSEEVVDEGGEQVWRGVWETLTGVLARERADVVDRELNGLRRVSQRWVGLPGAKGSGGWRVGESVLEGGAEVLASLKDVDGEDGKRVVEAVWLERGILSRSVSLATPGVVEERFTTYMVDAGDPLLPRVDGVFISKGTENFQGYEAYTLVWQRPLGDVVDYELNGLRRVTQKVFGLTVSPEANLRVGVSVYGGLYLAKMHIDPAADLAGSGKVSASLFNAELVWLEPGVVSKSVSGWGNEVPGVLRRQFVVWRMNVRDLTGELVGENAGAGAGKLAAGGFVVSVEDTQVQGFVFKSVEVLCNVPVDGYALVGTAPGLDNVGYPGEVSIVQPEGGWHFGLDVYAYPAFVKVVPSRYEQQAVTIKTYVGTDVSLLPGVVEKGVEAYGVGVVRRAANGTELGPNPDGGSEQSYWNASTDSGFDWIKGVVVKAGSVLEVKNWGVTKSRWDELSGEYRLMEKVNAEIISLEKNYSEDYRAPTSGSILSRNVRVLATDVLGRVIYIVREVVLP